MVIYAVVAVNTVEGDAGNEGPFGHLDYFFVDAFVIVPDIAHSLFPWVEFLELKNAESVGEEMIVVALVRLF